MPRDLVSIPRCDRCQLVRINGVVCHELTCPNFRSRWDAEHGWVRQRTCAECGNPYDVGSLCCEDGL